MAMIAQSSSRWLLLALGALSFTASSATADDAPPPPEFQALLKKHGVETIDHLVDACSTFEKSRLKTLTSTERKELLAVALAENIGDRDREKLVMTLWVSLRDSKTRIQEAIELTPLLTKLQEQKLPAGARGYAETRHYCLFCEVFSLEDKETGAERERAWFERIGQATGDDRKALLTALAYTQWTNRELRIAALQKVYVDKTADEDTRLTIVAVIFQGTIYGGIPLEICISYYRDLAKLPETTPTVTSKMFGYLAEYVYMARIANQINGTK